MGRGGREKNTARHREERTISEPAPSLCSAAESEQEKIHRQAGLDGLQQPLGVCAFFRAAKHGRQAQQKAEPARLFFVERGHLVIFALLP